MNCNQLISLFCQYTQGQLETKVWVLERQITFRAALAEVLQIRDFGNTELQGLRQCGESGS